MRLRSKAREVVLRALYEIEVGRVSSKYSLKDNLSRINLPEDAAKFVEYLTNGVADNLSRLDEVISHYALNWNISRMAIVDKNILRLAIFELLFVEDIPPKVSINEAVELAKKYGDVDSARFVNGILDSIYRQEIISKQP